MAKLKFGSPAWREKYMRKNKPKRKAAQRKRTASHKRGTAAKKKRMREMIGNPPSGWMNVRQVKVERKNGKTVLLVRK